MCDVGKILKLTSPNSTFGQALRTNGKIVHLSFSFSGLHVGDPIMYNISPHTIYVKNIPYRMPIATIIEGYNQLESDGPDIGKWKLNEINQLWVTMWEKNENHLNDLQLNENSWRNYRLFKGNTFF